MHVQAKATKVEKLKEDLKVANENIKKLNTEVAQFKNEVLNAKTKKVAK